jgi:hypothetical protein
MRAAGVGVDNLISLQGHALQLFTGQKAAILDLLLNRRGQWAPTSRVAELALQYSARVKELRDAGYTVENRTERVNGKIHGAFQLVACPGEDVPSSSLLSRSEATA